MFFFIALSKQRSPVTLHSLGATGKLAKVARFFDTNEKRQITFINVHVFQILQVLEIHLASNPPPPIVEFFNNYLLKEHAALSKYVTENEKRELQWDAHNCVINYNDNQRKVKKKCFFV